MTTQVSIHQLPQSIEEFVALRNQVAQTPAGGAAIMIVALHVYAGDPALGQQCLTIAVDRGRLEEAADGYKGWRLRRSDMQRIARQIQNQPYLPCSYIQGAAPENGYTLPEPPYSMCFATNPYSGDPDSGTFKVFVACSGAASARPVTLKRNDHGLWKASEWSTLIVGIQAPRQVQEDDL
jgi:hypothetical protein